MAKNKKPRDIMKKTLEKIEKNLDEIRGCIIVMQNICGDDYPEISELLYATGNTCDVLQKASIDTLKKII